MSSMPYIDSATIIIVDDHKKYHYYAIRITQE